jgi:hypothetical protein
VGAQHDLTFTGIFFQSRYRSQSNEFGSFVTSQSLAVDPSQSKFDANGALISSPAVFQRDSSTFAASGQPITAGGTTRLEQPHQDAGHVRLGEMEPQSRPLTVEASYQHINSPRRCTA